MCPFYTACACIIITLSIIPTLALSNNRNDASSIRRRQVVQHSLGIFSYAWWSISMSSSSSSHGSFDNHAVANAANLPESYGADLSKTGTIETLVPIVRMESKLKKAEDLLAPLDADSEVPKSTLRNLKEVLALGNKDGIPADEASIKKLFDAYSNPVSYKQRFMDSNAFLVYYTKGFDGPGRPSIESGDIPLQVLQYGARNDFWISFHEFLDELQYDITTSNNDSVVGDIRTPLQKSLDALYSFMKLAPEEDRVAAMRQI